MLSIMFFIAGLNLVGIPPLTGFIGKIGLAQASVEQGGWQGYSLLAAGMITSFLTLYAFVKVWNFAFWQPVDDEHVTDTDISHTRSRRRQQAERRAIQVATQRADVAEHMQEASRTKSEREGTGASRLMYVSAGSLIVVMIAMSVGAGPIYAYASNAALDQMDRATYLHAVLQHNGRGHGNSQYARTEAPENLQEFSKSAQEDVARDVRHDDRNIPAEVRPTRDELWSFQWRPPYIVDTDDPMLSNHIECLDLTRQYIASFPKTGGDSR